MAQYGVSQLYATMRLVGRSGQVWAGETAVTGWRIAAFQNSLPGLDSGDITLDQFLVNDATVNATTTNFNKAQGWAGDSGVGNINVTDAHQDAIAEAIWTYWSAVKVRLSPQYDLESVRLYAVLPTGVSGPAPCIYTPKVASPNTGSNTTAPQLSMVISTKSATRGRKGRGRWYIGPFSSGIIATDGRVDSTVGASVATAAVGLLNAFRNAGDVGAARYTPVIWHRGTQQAAVINGIRWGDEIDTQQRRRRQRPEVYTSVAMS